MPRPGSATGRPFYAATYFPPAQFASLLRRIVELWQEKREELEQSAQRVAGGFYSATDADSEGQEGLYFIWTPGQLRDVLNPAQLALVERLSEPTDEGNVEGANILALQSPLDSGLLATELTAVEPELDRVLQVLLDARAQRIAPLRDDQLIVAWSAAMAGSLAWAGWELCDQAYLAAAERALTFMLNHNGAGNDGLARVWLHGEVSVPAQPEDYANLCEALVTLYDVTGQAAHLKTAAR